MRKISEEIRTELNNACNSFLQAKHLLNEFSDKNAEYEGYYEEIGFANEIEKMAGKSMQLLFNYLTEIYPEMIALEDVKSGKGGNYD
ncbi:hypothetical protein [Veillonella sp.]|uniref:hypothetical protein n=1 Tax=Veillonella sp. TaxID=1926307 RepID=UPI0025E1E9E1|nr:hypothetical protein [Veillonella sp.]